MRETQASIGAWRQATFGDPGPIARAAIRTSEEMQELLVRLSIDDADQSGARVEAADVFICLCGIADRLDVDVARVPTGALIFFNNLSCATWGNSCLAMLIDALAMQVEGSELARRWLIALVACVRQLADRMGFDLAAAVDEKMAVNRARRWRISDQGHGYHEKGEA